MNDLWYRIEDRLVSSGVDEFDNPLGPPRLEIWIRELKVLSRTAKGVWLDRGAGSKRFVLNECRKRYACATLTEALESFRARKNKQARIYEKKAANAREALAMAEYEVYIRGGA